MLGGGDVYMGVCVGNSRAKCLTLEYSLELFHVPITKRLSHIMVLTHHLFMKSLNLRSVTYSLTFNTENFYNCLLK